nr:MAG TPA: hypothetical protein [Caudoviricetes sp.]
MNCSHLSSVCIQRNRLSSSGLLEEFASKISEYHSHTLTYSNLITRQNNWFYLSFQIVRPDTSHIKIKARYKYLSM